jgi:hypothetical protein
MIDPFEDGDDSEVQFTVFKSGLAEIRKSKQVSKTPRIFSTVFIWNCYCRMTGYKRDTKNVLVFGVFWMLSLVFVTAYLTLIKG